MPFVLRVATSTSTQVSSNFMHEDNLAGVIGHEIAHADLRHSTQQLTQAFGLSVLLAILTDSDPGLLGEVAAGLVNLSFSHQMREADEASVDYLLQHGLCCGRYRRFLRAT